ncbi:hypothetical protein ACOMHN_031016 [Nucella lapillus]
MQGGNGSTGLEPAMVDSMETRLRDMQTKIKVGNFRILAPVKPSDGHFRFRYRDLAASQAQRQERIRHVCKAKQLQEQRGKPLPEETPYHEGWYGRKFLYAVMEVYEPQRFFFCPVLKVGSTFFRRLFYALGNEQPIHSPYDITIETALSGKRNRHPNDLLKPGPANKSIPAGQGSKATGRRLTSLEDVDGRAPYYQRVSHTPQEDKRIRDFLRDAGKVMFTRDPYTKLLSGYMDKLFAPNPYFWHHVGKYIVRTFRPKASALSLRCGHDVTFPEFIRYVIENESHGSKARDTHFVPSYDQCKPCDFDYDVIGKMETFSADVSLVLAQLGYNVSQSTLDKWAGQSEQDAILDSIKSPYVHWKRSIVKCMPWREANKRIWRKLQTRGLVDKTHSLPMEDFPKDSLAFGAFSGKVQQYWKQFRTSGLQSQQKREALSSAYNGISQKDLELVREYFLLDFDLYQYDSRPDVVFKAKQTWDVFTIS